MINKVPGQESYKQLTERKFTFEEVSSVVCGRLYHRLFVAHDSFEGGLQSNSAVLVVNIEPEMLSS